MILLTLEGEQAVAKPVPLIKGKKPSKATGFVKSVLRALGRPHIVASNKIFCTFSVFWMLVYNFKTTTIL